MALVASCVKSNPEDSEIIILWGNTYDIETSLPIEGMCVALSNKDTTYTNKYGEFLFEVPTEEVSALTRIRCIDKDGLDNGGKYREAGMELSFSPSDAVWSRRSRSYEIGGLEIFMELFEPVN